MIIGMDYETYYDQDYSLKKMTTHEYIMDPRFHAHGAAVSINLAKSVWMKGPQLDEFITRVTQRVGWENVIMLGHNLKFDGCILAWRHGVRPAVYLDTLAMSNFVYGPTVQGHSLDQCYLRATGVTGKAKSNHLADVKGVRHLAPEQDAALGSYACDDMDETVTVYHHLKARFPKEEIKRSSWCVQMAANPVLCLDADMVKQVVADEKDKKAEVIRSLGVTRTALSSNPQMADALRALGVEPPTKKSPTTGKDTFAFAATDMEFDALLGHEDSRVRDLVRGRLVIKSTIEETRAERFVKVHELFGGRMPVFLNYAGASQTNRLSGCLTGNTEIVTLSPTNGLSTKPMTDLLPDDLVWDGEDFVAHGGLVFSGYKEVITHDGVTATPDHVVFTDSGDEISILDARSRGDRIQSPRSPSPLDVDAARERAGWGHHL